MHTYWAMLNMVNSSPCTASPIHNRMWEESTRNPKIGFPKNSSVDTKRNIYVHNCAMCLVFKTDFASIGINDKLREWSSISWTTISISGLRPRARAAFGIASPVSKCARNEGQSLPAFGRMATDCISVRSIGSKRPFTTSASLGPNL